MAGCVCLLMTYQCLFAPYPYRDLPPLADSYKESVLVPETHFSRGPAIGSDSPETPRTLMYSIMDGLLIAPDSPLYLDALEWPKHPTVLMTFVQIAERNATRRGAKDANMVHHLVGIGFPRGAVIKPVPYGYPYASNLRGSRSIPKKFHQAHLLSWLPSRNVRKPCIFPDFTASRIGCIDSLDTARFSRTSSPVIPIFLANIITIKYLWYLLGTDHGIMNPLWFCLNEMKHILVAIPFQGLARILVNKKCYGSRVVSRDSLLEPTPKFSQISILV
ncbi:hypothetical protein VNO77_44176 [Canavalia gladiata]|uniref:Uncharacterized protein n=1 Tax=Canavalia gladiata TaxID=3824 RepID=A0AAN9JVJ9_CANGL